jgi:two-component system nitrogen regulation sensor histidine kinase GlnL
MKELSFTVDKDLRIRSWSDDLTLFTGEDASRVIGKAYTDIFPKFLMHDKEAVRESFRSQRTISLKQHRFQCLAHHRQADIRISPAQNGSASIGAVEIVLQPSEPCSVGQQLIDAQKLIAIGKIAATLAHGVRNPLNAIKGAVVYLRDRYAHEKPLVEFTDILESEIARLESFISRFLNTTTFDSDIALVDINALITKIKAFVSLQTYTRDIQCEYHLGEIPPIQISSFHLEQAILNVINNAIEAMRSGGTLTIRTHLTTSLTAPCIAIEITDTGSGLEHPAQSVALPCRYPPQPGRGFGLFIADEIIKYYKGHLTIHGEKGKGTSVTFLLPVSEYRNGVHHE